LGLRLALGHLALVLHPVRAPVVRVSDEVAWGLIAKAPKDRAQGLIAEAQ
jgi:hypothetical protein